MSAIAFVAPGRRTQTGLPRAARRLLVQLAAASVAFGVATSLAGTRDAQWTTFVVLLVAAVGAQAVAVHVSGNQVFHTGLAFTVAAAVTLQPREVIAICLVQHLGDWVRRRYAWYVQVFNIANYTLSALAAWGVNRAIVGSVGDASASLRVGAACAAGAAFVLTNHALLARMLKLARNHSLQATGLFSFDGMLTDVSLAATGVGVAVALKHYPAAAVVAAFPLFLIHRALVIPELRLQALRDPKTALLNMRGLRDAAETELARAERFMRPLSVIVLDIDDMRQINSAHGHLAGDAAICAVADAMHAATRDLDLCARFGGDEFVLVLPETTADEAEALALRLHERVAEDVVGSPAVTVSSGVAELAPGTQTLDELLQRADAAMYEAKRGRATVSV